MHQLLKIQFFRFLLVGGLNATFSYGVYATLLFMGWSYVWANLSAFLLGILFSFRTQGALVFHNRESGLIFKFAACWCLIFGLNILLIWFLLQAGLNTYLAGAAVLVPISILSYFIQKFIVFGNSQPSRHVTST